MIETPDATLARGDTELAAGLVRDLGVVPSAGAGVEAGWSEYLAYLFQRAISGVLSMFVRAFDALPLPPGWPKILAMVVVVLAVLLLVFVAVRAILAHRKKRRAAEDGSPEVIETTEDEATERERDAAAWRAELEALLAAGRMGEALRATWWWLARALAGERADPSWTGRELLDHAGRRDLLPAVRRLEAFTYGGRRPEVEELRRLSGELADGLGVSP